MWGTPWVNQPILIISTDGSKKFATVSMVIPPLASIKTDGDSFFKIAAFTLSSVFMYVCMYVWMDGWMCVCVWVSIIMLFECVSFRFLFIFDSWLISFIHINICECIVSKLKEFYFNKRFSIYEYIKGDESHCSNCAFLHTIRVDVSNMVFQHRDLLRHTARRH